MSENPIELAQKVLDKLWKESRMPFELTAYKLESLGEDGYQVNFHDARLHSVAVSCPAGESFTNAFHAAILVRIGKLSDPLPTYRMFAAN